MKSFEEKYISRTILIALLLSNLFTFNSFSSVSFKKNNGSDVIIESATVQEIILAGQKTNKTQLQKIIKSYSPEFIQETSISAKHKNFIKIPVQHFSLLNFQFFLSSQFSTDT